MGRGVLSAAVLALFCAGCLGRILKKEPEPEWVRVKDVGATFAPEGRASFKVRFAVDNPQKAAGAISGLEWEIWIDGRWFAAGTEALAEPLPRGERELQVDLPVVFRRFGVKEGLSSLQVGVRGGLEGSVDGNDVRLPFQQTLTVQSNGAPIFNDAEGD